MKISQTYKDKNSIYIMFDLQRKMKWKEKYMLVYFYTHIHFRKFLCQF